MDAFVIELVKRICEAAAEPLGRAIGEKTIVEFKQGLLDAVPFLKYLTVLRRHQLEKSCSELNRRMRQIEVTQDKQQMLGFANMCYRYFEVGSKEHRELKLRMLAAACAHCANAHNPDPFDIQLEMCDAIERLQPFHFAIMRYLEDRCTGPRPNGGRRHPKLATFQELSEAGLSQEESDEFWLLKALVVLVDMGAIDLEKGSFMGMGKEGWQAVQASPFHVIPHDKIGLTRFGGQILRYVRSAIEDERTNGEDESRQDGHPAADRRNGPADRPPRV